MAEGFDRYLEVGRPYFLPRRRISLADAIKTILDSENVKGKPLTARTIKALVDFADETAGSAKKSNATPTAQSAASITSEPTSDIPCAAAGMETMAKEEQPWKALSPMAVTWEGMVMPSKRRHPSNSMLPRTSRFREPPYITTPYRLLPTAVQFLNLIETGSSDSRIPGRCMSMPDAALPLN